MKKLNKVFLALVAVCAIGFLTTSSCQREIDEMNQDQSNVALEENGSIHYGEFDNHDDTPPLAAYVSWDRQLLYVAAEDEEFIKGHLGIRVQANGKWSMEHPTKGWLDFETTVMQNGLQKTENEGLELGDDDVIDPIVGDQHIYQKAACTWVIPAQNWTCKKKIGNFFSDGTTKQHKRCKRNLELNTSCTETYQKIGLAIKYTNANCNVVTNILIVNSFACWVAP